MGYGSVVHNIVCKYHSHIIKFWVSQQVLFTDSLVVLSSSSSPSLCPSLSLSLVLFSKFVYKYCCFLNYYLFFFFFKQVYAKLATSLKHFWSSIQECPAAFVFFKTRYAAVVAAQVLQSSNPMLWVTDLAPEPHDVYWSNLCIPYRQLWIRKIGTLVAAIAFMLVFLIPVAFVQGLTQLEQLQQTFPFLRGLLKK